MTGLQLIGFVGSSAVVLVMLVLIIGHSGKRKDRTPSDIPERENIERPLDAHLHCELCAVTVRTEQ